MVSLKDFTGKYGSSMANARREGFYGFPMSIPKKLKGDAIGMRAINRAFGIGKAERRVQSSKKNRK